MRRETADVLLVLLGGALVKITLDGTFLRYVKPGAGPWVLAAGVVVVGLGVVGVVRDVVTDSVREHAHSGGWPWLLVLPVLTIFLVSPPALGADSVVRDGGRAVLAVRPVDLAPLPRSGVVSLGVNEFVARAVWDSSGALVGRNVVLVGFVVHEDGADYVARLVITCCAADATPMKVALTGHRADRLPDDQWVRVGGRLRPGSATVADGYTPILVVSSLVTVDAPADPYEY